MLCRTIRIVAVFLSLAVGGYLVLLPLYYQSGDRPASRPYAARFPPSAFLGVDRNFSPTPAELACLRGKPAPAEGEHDHRTDAPSSASEPFPNTVHFVFLQKLPLPSDGQGDFGLSCYLSLRSALGVLKPNPAMYRLGLSLAQIRPDEAVMIDDRPQNAEAARSVGMHAVRYANAAQLREELAALGVR